MQVLALTTLPIYLPADIAPVPFGDPLSDVTITSSTTAIVTVPGYDAPVANDAVSFSVVSGSTLASGITVGAVYYVVAPISGDTFAISTAKGGAVVATTTSTTAGKPATIHLLSKQVYGPNLPFKPGSTAVALNLTAAAITVSGAADVNSGFGNPGGPGSLATIATVASGSAQILQLSTDWVVLSSGGPLVLLQN